MAKRKQSIAQPSSRKRVKGSQSSAPPVRPPRPSAQEYKLRAILQEDGGHYLIDWEDDEQTGERFKPTWEPKRNANKQAVTDWNARKAAAATKSPEVRITSETRSSGNIRATQPSSESTPTRQVKRKLKLRKVIDSSSPSQPVDSSKSLHENGDAVLNGSNLEISESQSTSPRSLLESPGTSSSDPITSERALDSQSRARSGEAQIHLPEPPSSFAAGAYEKFSQLEADSTLATQNQDSELTDDPSIRIDTSQAPADPLENSINQSSVEPPIGAYPSSTDLQGSAAKVVIPDSQSLLSAVDPQAAHGAATHSLTRLQDYVTQQPQTAPTESSRPPKSNYYTDQSSSRPLVNSSSQNPETNILQQGPDRGQSASSSPLNSASSLVETAVLHQNASPNRDRGTILRTNGFTIGGRSQKSSPLAPRSSKDVNRDSQGSSLPQSSFPFETQIHYPASSGTATARTTSKTYRGNQVSSNTKRWADTPNKTPSSLQETINRSARESSLSSISRVPSHLNPERRSGSAPPYKSRLASPFNMEDATRSSQSTPHPVKRSQGPLDNDNTHSTPNSSKHEPGTLTAKLKSIREHGAAKRKAERGYQLSSSISSIAADNSEPQSSVPSRLISEEPSASGPGPLGLPFSVDRARSPSAVPAQEPLPTITLEKQNTSERLETLLPQAQGSESAARTRNSSVTAGTPLQRPLQQVDENGTVHVVPIILVGHQRDQYPQTIYYYREMIQRFLSTPDPDDQLLRDANEFIDIMRRLVLHPDLNNPETQTQYDVEPAQQADWDINCSAKFRFLKELLDDLRGKQLSIIITASSGRIGGILFAFLQATNIPVSRVDRDSQEHSSDGSREPLRTFLLSPHDSQAVIGKVDLVIAIDDAVPVSSPLVKNVRHRDGKWAPYLQLVVPRSVEHIEMSLSPTLSDSASRKAVLKSVYELRDEAGKRTEGQMQPKDTAKAIAAYILAARDNPPWPIASLLPLEDLDSQTDSNADDAGHGVVEIERSTGEKRSRPFDDVDAGGIDPAKRPRVGSTDADSHQQQQQGDVTHISDSVDMTSSIANQNPPESSLSHPIHRPEDIIAALQEKLEEHIQALSGLQYRYEDQRTALVEVTRERDKAIETAAQAVKRYSEQSNQLSTLRAERTALKQQLEEANTKLQEHTIPERAEFEKLRLALEQQQKEKEKSRTQLESANGQLDYLRNLYQNSANIAQAHASQIADLETELAESKRKATGEQVRLRQAGYDNFTKKLRDENKQLKVMMKEREAGLHFRDEEISRLKEANRGRMGTRGTSVPRSPRPGSPLRMGSRQASPAVGELRGRGTSGLSRPLRNA